MDIAEFLTARLDEEQRIAEAASPGPWRPSAEKYEVLAVDDEVVCDGFALSNNQLRWTVDHIALHDPVRVLADVAAKRAVLSQYEQVRHETDYDGGHAESRDALENVLEALVQSYAHHPDFDPAWMPEPALEWREISPDDPNYPYWRVQVPES